MNSIEEKNLEVIKGLYPEKLWQMFALISSIPRGSKNETAVAKFVYELAEKRFQVRRDKIGNVVVCVAASLGFEDRPSICLQAHLDMVCEKRSDINHNFITDPIEFMLSDGKLMADGTTLGADNGIGLAAMLAIITENEDFEHGPLELLFTIDEETGLNGAKKVPVDFIKSKVLINLDSEDWGQFYMSSAGGMRTKGRIPISFVNPPTSHKTYLKIMVKGLKGGHSGTQIDRPHENPIKVLGRVITMLTADNHGKLVRIDGGGKFNAIPRDASAIVCVQEVEVALIRRKIERIFRIIGNEIGSFEPKFQITVDILPKCRRKVIAGDSQENLCRLLSIIPHGVIRMSADVPGLVQTSTNLASVKTTRNGIVFETMQRGSVDTETLQVVGTIDSAFKFAGGKTLHSGWYQGWPANPSSAILAFTRDIFMEMFHKEPEIKVIHAGLECGVIGAKFPGMDIISFGPTIMNVHSPDEYVDIDSVGNFWNFLLALLKTYGAPATSA